MITAISDQTDYIAALTAIAPCDPFACRIISLCHSYKPELAFVDYWLEQNGEGEVVGAIARNGSNFILYLTERSDLGEMASFMRIGGASGVICSGAFELDLSMNMTTGSILMRQTPFDETDVTPKAVVPDIRAAYELIVSCADAQFQPPVFEDFYVDVNHKLRHNAMRLIAIQDGGKPVALAMTVAESENGAVLGAVACSPDYRRRGYGSAVVRQITDSLVAEGKTVFLHRAKHANVSFYQQLGFTECGTWREYSL